MPMMPAFSIEAPRPAGSGAEPLLRLQDATLQVPQPPLQIPQTDIVVEVVGQLPLRTKLEDVSRLLAQRGKAGSIYRTYPPIILELITLVERNPVRPTGRNWDSIFALTIGFDHQTNEVTVEYCIDYCTTELSTGAPHPKRKMVVYKAPEQTVVKRLNKKLGDLKKYSTAPPQ